MLFPVWDLGALIHLCKVPSHSRLTLMAELGTQSFVSCHLDAAGVPFQPSLASAYCQASNSFS